MQKLLTLLILALIVTGCGNDPITNAGYFDDDVDKSVTTEQPNTGAQVFNNYGSGTMTVNNTVNYNSSAKNTAASLSNNTITTLSASYQDKLSFELHGGSLYVLNNTSEKVRVRLMYRSISPFGAPYESEKTIQALSTSSSIFVSIGSVQCVQIESISFLTDGLTPSILNTEKTSIQVCEI